jgi:hypothetical protein
VKDRRRDQGKAVTTEAINAKKENKKGRKQNDRS